MVDDSDPVELISRRNSRARVQHKCHECVQHKCHECGRRIEQGETYLAEFYKSDGRTEGHKTCTHCRVVRQWLGDECGGWLYHGVEEDICEHADEGYYGFGVKLLAIGIRRGWRRRDGGLWPVPRLPKTTHDRMDSVSPPA